MAYCSKDLESLMRECIAHMPLHVYSNQEYARFSKGGEEPEVPQDEEAGQNYSGGSGVQAGSASRSLPSASGEIASLVYPSIRRIVTWLDSLQTRLP